MPISFTKISLSIATLAIVSACGSSTTPTVTPPVTTLNFNANTTTPSALTSTTQTGLASSNALNSANYDQPTDTLTLERTGTTDLVIAGSAVTHPQESNVRGYRINGSESGVAMIAQSSNGDGYAVALYDDSTSTALDPQGSSIVGGTSSSSLTNSALGNASFTGAYLGYANQTIGGLAGGSSTVAGNAQIDINAAGTGIAGTTVITNRTLSNGNAVADLTTVGGALTGTSGFNGIVMNSTGLLGRSMTGTMNGTFVEADSSNANGEVVGAIVMQGGNGACTFPGGDVSVLGANCVMETGVFLAD
mgnify:CR=1 FL=1